MFLFKKIASAFLSPVGICVVLLLLGLVFLWFTRRQKLGKILVTASALLLMLFGSVVFSNMLLRPLENQYVPLAIDEAAPSSESLPRAKWIAVMGASWSADSRLPANSQIKDIFLARFVEAARVRRAIPDSKVIVSVAGTSSGEEKTAFLECLATSTGLDLNDAVVIADARDSKDEARLIKQTIGDNSVILVTSACHMPRSVALFKGQGMDPIPSPAGHLLRGEQRLRLRDVLPSTKGLHRTGVAFHEYLGMLWAKLRGQTQFEPSDTTDKASAAYNTVLSPIGCIHSS